MFKAQICDRWLTVLQVVVEDNNFWWLVVADQDHLFAYWGIFKSRVCAPLVATLSLEVSASLKFTNLIPKGRIWTMVAIYAHTVGDLGYASELGNYVEYSGAPDEEEVLQYARVVIDCATANPDGQRRALIVGGSFANFIDVAATFNGIIRAIIEKVEKLKAANMHVYIRGDPNYPEGLVKICALVEEIGIPIEVKIKTIFLPTEVSLNPDTCAPLVATLSLEIKLDIEKFIEVIYALFIDHHFTVLEINPFALVDGKPYPLEMRGELDDTATLKDFITWLLKSWKSVLFHVSASLKFTNLIPEGQIWTMVAIYAHTVGDLGYASKLGKYAEYSGAPDEEEVLQYARVVIDCATANPDGQRRALIVGGSFANFTNVAATFNGIIRAISYRWKKLKAANMHIYIRRDPNYPEGLVKIRALVQEIGIPIEVKVF
ncbi:ATP-citrate synthase alpha chain protein 1 [Helianthus annuus]|uniref:ATP-citrate synthase alpha chain protein 1 n=1 Tax=Helianthus annuus TaxID=4232 RepID=UPI001652ED22|nr:ATP-citrate synthase alpha chain protein 1 [Helianthus annuus]